MSLEQMSQLTSDLWICGQLDAADFAQLAARGFRTAINMRPDHEADAQPTSDALAAAAAQAGLRYEFLPVVASQIREQDVDTFAHFMDTLPKPVLAFCRTGNRCSIMWSRVKAQSDK
jgi:sulfide:quinone oxidoreductase